MPPSRISTLDFDAAFNPQTIEGDIAALRGDWGFELWGWVYLNELMPRHFFRIWVCSRPSIARDVTVTAWARLRANRQHFLAGVLLMDEETSWTSVQRSVADVVRECDAASQGDWQRFYDLMLRFVEWDEATFESGYHAAAPEISKTMQLQIPRVSADATLADAPVFPCTGSIEVEPGIRSGFSFLTCTTSWIASGRESLGDALLSPKTLGTDYVFPSGLVVVNDGSDWTEVEPALRQAFEECESRAERDRAYFRTLASRFIVWDGDPFAFPWSM